MNYLIPLYQHLQSMIPPELLKANPATWGQEMQWTLNKAFTEGNLGAVASAIIQIQKRTPIKKAIATSAFGTYAGMEPLRIEDLSGVMTRQVFGANTVPLFRRLTKTPAYNTYVQYDRLIRLGIVDNGFPFFMEGNLPRPDDSAWRRMNDTIKLHGTLRSVTHLATQVKTGAGVTNIRAEENENGMTFLLHNIEMALWYAQKSCGIVNGGYELAYDGVIPSLLRENSAYEGTLIVDKHGYGLTPDDIKESALKLVDIGMHAIGLDQYDNMVNLGTFMSPTQSNVINNYLGPFARWQMGGKGQQVIPGQYTPGVQTQFGYMPNIPDIWLGRYRKINSYAPAASLGRPPTAPTAVTIAAVPTATGSYWQADDAGRVYYAVTGVSADGETAIVAASPAYVDVAEGGAVDITITLPTDNPPMALNIWRGPDADHMQLVWMIPPGTTNPFVWRDLNYFMPGTDFAVTAVWEPQAVDISELTPFFSMNLGIIDTSFRWLQMYYGCPRLRNPLKFIIYRNCGTRLT